MATNKLNTQRGIGENLLKKPYNNLREIDHANANGMLVTSTNIRIKANDVVIGMIQSFSVSQSRDVTKLQQIGAEGVAQAVPQNYKGGTLQCSRVALYGSRFYDAFKMEQYSGEDTKDTYFKTLKDQRLPFDVVYEQSASNNGQMGPQYTETYISCWISSYKANYTVSNITVSENVSIAFADII